MQHILHIYLLRNAEIHRISKMSFSSRGNKILSTILTQFETEEIELHIPNRCLTSIVICKSTHLSWYSSKNSINPHFRTKRIKKKFINFNYSTSSIFFTDGSKQSEGFGAAYYNSGSVASIWLNTNASELTSELYAVLKVRQHQETTPPGEFLICTDSLSGLTMIKDKLLLMQHNANRTMNCIWVPGHVDEQTL